MWRIQAKHQTKCPRCRGYIKIGAWIVQDPTYGTKWSHAVCPADVRKLASPNYEERNTRESKIKFGGGGKATAMETI